MTSAEVRERQGLLSEHLARVTERCPFWNDENELETVQFAEGTMLCLRIYHWQVVPWTTGYTFWLTPKGELVEKHAKHLAAQFVDPSEVVGGYVAKIIAALKELEVSFANR